MDHKKIYYNIIENRRLNPLDGYTETHHIIPVSLGGSNDSTNLVKLSAREHFICHYLLTKFWPCDQTFYAFMMMKCSSSNQKRYYNSRLYETNRVNYAKAVSKIQSGPGNSQYGTIWINNGSINKKIKNTDSIPENWCRGRIKVHSEVSKEKIGSFRRGKPGKLHSEETKSKMSENRKNSYFWITNGRQNKRVKDLTSIPKNWYKGMTLDR